uniref:Gasdermin pore forming domain-containing protein n=1 Tax=Terrapene triunguis TaxID=2587831 RepID=A0A674IVD1_9SAUR
MFHKATKDLAKQVAPDGDLFPVSSLIDQDHFRPLYLVRNKPKKGFWMTRHRYYKTGVQLSDILVPGQDSRNLGNASLPTLFTRPVWQHCLQHPGLERLFSFSDWPGNYVKRAEVSPKLSSNAESTFFFFRKINMDHSIIKDLRKRRENLYVINEAVQALEESTLYKANGTRGSKRVIVIPKDCVLAFRIKPLIIQSESWGKYHPENSNGGMEGLQSDVEKECAKLSQLSTDLRAKFLKSIIAVIINSDLLQELTLKVKLLFSVIMGLETHTHTPPTRSSFLPCDHLSVQHLLIWPPLPYKQITKRTTPALLWREDRQNDSVKSILKQEFHLKDAFSLDAKLVSSLQEEELNITKAMIELGGVTLQRNGPSFTGTGDLAAFSALSALYVALYALHLLSRSE